MTRSQRPSTSGRHQTSEPVQAFKSSDVLVFVEDAATTSACLSHAGKVAGAFGGEVILVQVLCKPLDNNGPVDPVEWDIRKQQTLKRLGGQSDRSDDVKNRGSVRLLEGQCINQIRAFMDVRQGDIAASVRPHDALGWLSSETARGVLLSRSAGVLMIPGGAATGPDSNYRRVFVPLDGSTRAEAALPVAVTLARAENAHLVICYVLPVPGLTEFGARDSESERLHAIVRRRNEQAGKTYLARIRKNLEHNGLQISVRISSGDDVRRELIDIMSKENADFVVMATHGQSGHKDVPTGDVARFILDKSAIPVLLVRTRNSSGKNHAFGSVSSKGVRQPAGTD